MEPVRLRLVFEGHNTLNKSQKKEGLKRSWIRLKPQHRYVVEFSSYLLDTFGLRKSCPDGLILSMDGFVLPPFESTSILKDKDIISVKKKGGKSSKILKLDNGLNSLEELEIVEQPPVDTGIKLLANEEFDKETGGYESEPEEDEQELESLENQAPLESTPIENMVSKKRKASNGLPKSKRKKSKLGSAEKSLITENDRNNGNLKKSKSSHQKTVVPKEKVVEKNTINVDREPEESSSTEIDKSRENENSTGRFHQLQETGKGSVDVSQTTSEAKKLPSRSARRKKAKRRWLRERAKMEMEKLHLEQLIGKDNQQSPAKENLKFYEEQIQPVKSSDVEDNMVPIVVRPGHIRFEPLEEEDAERPVQQNQNSMGQETFQWNGITSKKKGQKWGMEKSTFPKRNEDQRFSQVSSEMVAIGEKTTVTDDMDFDKLSPYTSLPKVGDLVAYRLVELSSSWTPELCSFRVGKISHYDAESTRILLIPVPEYPSASKKIDGEESEEQLGTSLYGEDGSLEIEYSSLVDVRLVKHGSSSTIESVASDINENCAQEQNVLTSRPNGSKEKEAALISAPPPAQANGVANGWEEVSQALSAKKAELSKENGWNQTDSSGRSSWSYRALRHCALGPTMAFLRAKNGI